MSKLHRIRICRPRRMPAPKNFVDKKKLPWVELWSVGGTHYKGRLGAREGNVVTLYDAYIQAGSSTYPMLDGILVAFSALHPTR
jgi:hypothetical protein